MPVIYSGCGDTPLITLICLVGFFGLLVVGVILLRKYVKPFQSDEKPKSKEEIANEEVNRILQPIEDEKTAKQVNSYKTETKKVEKDEGEDKPILK